MIGWIQTDRWFSYTVRIFWSTVFTNLLSSWTNRVSIQKCI